MPREKKGRSQLCSKKLGMAEGIGDTSADGEKAVSLSHHYSLSTSLRIQ
jgi:hypothetical protein